MPLPSPAERDSYRAAVLHLGVASDALSRSASLFKFSLLPNGAVLSVAPEMRVIDGERVAVVVIGLDAEIVAAADLDTAASKLSTLSWLSSPPGVRWIARRERRPTNQTLRTSRDSLARPGDLIATVRAPLRAGGVAENLSAGGTLGGWVLVGGNQIGLVSCAHVIATDHRRPSDRASLADVVTWPGWMQTGDEADTALRDRRLATLWRWTGRDDVMDAALAVVDERAARALIAASAEDSLRPTSIGRAEPGDIVRFRGASGDLVREGVVASSDAQIRVRETGQIIHGCVSYGRDLGGDRWESVTQFGDSGAWLVRDDRSAVGMHKMASSCGPSSGGACVDDASTLSYAQPLGEVLCALRSSRDLPIRASSRSLRAGPLTVELLPADRIPIPPSPVPARPTQPARPRSFTCRSVSSSGESLMEGNVTFQFNFCGEGGGAPSDPIRPAAPSSRSAAASGNQGFPRFSRFRMSNGLSGSSADDKSLRKVTSVKVTPARPLPVKSDGTPKFTGTTFDVVVPAAPLLDQSSVAVGPSTIGMSAANQRPSKFSIEVKHEKAAGGGEVTTLLPVDLGDFLGGAIMTNFITEIDVDLSFIDATTVLFSVRASYTFNGGISESQELKLEQFETVT